MVVLWQKNQQTARNADLRRQPRALGSNRVFQNLNHHSLPFKQLLFNRVKRCQDWRRRSGCERRTGFSMPAVDTAHQISDMQKGGPVQTDVDESRLHARQHPRHLAQVDIANQATLQRALNLQFLHRPLLNHGNPGFLRRPIDQDILLHCFVGDGRKYGRATRF